MSGDTNTRLFERAADMIDYWTGSFWERAIERDLDANDLESLHYHVSHAEYEAAIQEDYRGEMEAVDVD